MTKKSLNWLQKKNIFTKNVTSACFVLSNSYMANQQDIETIEAVLAGNNLAFENIVRRYQSMIFTLAFRIIGQREEAEEIAQDVFVKAYKALGTFHRKSNFSTWLYRITYNESINCLRSRHKKIESVEINRDIINLMMDIPDASDEYEEKKMIWDCIMALPEIERIIITLYYYEEMPVKEVAEVTGLTETNVKARLFRTRQKLYDEIRDKQQKLNRLTHGR